MLPYVRLLREQGYRCDVACSFPEKYNSFSWLGWRLSQRLKRSVRQWHTLLATRRKYSTIIIERELFDNPSVDLELKLCESGARVVLDIDDGIFLRYPEKFSQLLPAVDHVITGSQMIADAIAPQCRSISVIPTVVDINDYIPHTPETSEPENIIGWIGTDSNIAYLNEITPVIARLQQDRPLRFRVITGQQQSLNQLSSPECKTEFVPWNPRTATAELAKFTIGTMPLPNDPWQQYKCGCKLIEYLACEVPAIASPVGVNRDIIIPGDNGYLASTPEEWEAAFIQLLDSAVLRRTLGHKGRNMVEQKYTAQAQFPNFMKAIASQS